MAVESGSERSSSEEVADRQRIQGILDDIAALSFGLRGGGLAVRAVLDPQDPVGKITDSIAERVRRLSEDYLEARFGNNGHDSNTSGLLTK